MIRGRTLFHLGSTLFLSSVILGGIGCAKKQLSSSTGDQSMTTQGRTPVEAIQPDRIASIEPPADNRPLRNQAARADQAPSPGTGGGQPSVNASSSQDIASLNNRPGVAQTSSGIGDIFFDFDQYTIRIDAQQMLEQNGQWMRTESGKSLLIEGHCDERGTLAYNLVLGEKRAKSAKRYLENLGIASSRLYTTSYGEVKPSCTEHNENCWKFNRRAHFVVQ